MLSATSLYIATPEQTVVARERAAKHWGQPLTLDEFLEREVLSENEEYGREGKLRTWVLAPRDNPTTLDFFSSCKTFKRKIAISRPSQSELEPVLELGFGYAISSVLTASQYRKKGYGKHLMQLLHWVLAHEDYLSSQVFPEAEWGPRPTRVNGVGDGWLSVLWSDVGPKFYKECGIGTQGDGWVDRNSVSVIWKLKEIDLPVEVLHDSTEEVIWLDEELAKDVWEKDTELIKLELVQNAKEGRAQFAILPNGGVAYYQWSRMHYHFSRYVQDPPRYCGVRIGKRAFVTRTCDYRPGSPKLLIVTRLRAGEAEIGRLIEHTLRYAKALEVEQVEVWNLSGEAIFGGESAGREKSLSCLKWYSEGTEPGWVYNERYNWC